MNMGIKFSYFNNYVYDNTVYFAKVTLVVLHKQSGHYIL